MILPHSLQSAKAIGSTALTAFRLPVVAANNVVNNHQLAVRTILLLSGGAASTDLTRFRLRLDGLHTYSVITSLLMNAALRLFSSTPKRFEQGKRFQNSVKVLFSVATTVSVLAGSYTTIVFSLLGLYAKRALGRGHMDAACMEFFDRTLPIRDVAYDTCLISLVSFQAAFCLSLYLNHDDGFDWKIGCFAGVLALACWWHWSTILLLARTLFQFGVDM